MNKLLFILLILPFSAFSQKDLTKYDKDTIVYAPLPVDSTGAIVFRRVYDAPNTPKTELYARAKIWTAIAFRSAKNAIQLDDDQKNNLIIKGVIEAVNDGDYNIWFTMQFTIKDNKFRVLISQFSIERLLVNYDLVKEFEDLYEYNVNVKNGSGDFNNQNGITKHHAKQIASRCQVVSDFANAEFQEIQKAMQQSAKGDDF
jgi:hypothetical protein